LVLNTVIDGRTMHGISNVKRAENSFHVVTRFLNASVISRKRSLLSPDFTGASTVYTGVKYINLRIETFVSENEKVQYKAADRQNESISVQPNLVRLISYKRSATCCAHNYRVPVLRIFGFCLCNNLCPVALIKRQINTT
jgi:hypothetical protein